MTKKKLYLAIDAHARHCVLGVMTARGDFLGSQRFVTGKTELIKHVTAIDAGTKILTVEEGPLAAWISQEVTPYVTQVLVADPREIPLISRNALKNDKVDVKNLCRLLRLGELKNVYHPEDDSRAVFKAAVQQYLDFRDQQVEIKHKIKAKYRCWGVPQVFSTRVYHRSGRQKYLEKLTNPIVRNQLKRLYRLMDETLLLQAAALRDAKKLGQTYPELSEFVKIPGVGDIGALIFDAYIQTPHRFRKKSQLYRYCQLSVTDRSSDGKPLAHKRLDRAGNSELKAMSYRAVLCARNMKNDNEVKRFYALSLQETQNATHARLNTQRKVLSVLHGIWRRKDEYRPELFHPDRDKSR